ncbi:MULTISPECIES: IS3 family transposase [Salmonella]|nr:IS3 family transposase [Salmonella enterica]MCL8734551.1 IS3 family transposase [Salmonella enterica subsp. enterica serovar Enteritidis]MBW6541018.1 IS3 family transposase [Salmonella enterica subsp. enterica serovar Weltevreden]MBW6546463.1 IS3 family transposase [Salmonella enterica subsp. enterica serovar Weltevreden]MBW6550675.1 IS3 family transposase [Salmonella enterica subsp. enterica serovar Weltevreden]MBW6555660.1 IS3 family transposase [Salmonella enterica subsp. enterica serova
MGTPRFTPEFKEEAVRQITERGYSVAEVSDRLGVSTHSLYKWLRAIKPDNSEQHARDLLEAKSEILKLRAQLKRIEEERDILKKGRAVLCKGARLKYRFINEHRTVWGVMTMCRVLNVARAGFYAWLHNPVSARDKDNQRLLMLIRDSYSLSGGVYGYRRVHGDLNEIGETCGKNRVGRIMQLNRIKAVRGYKAPRRIAGRPSVVAPNRVQRQFTVVWANQIWVTDITYIRTWQGWLYLAVVIDLFARNVVGWSMKPTLSRELALDALMMAVWRRKPDGEVVVHSDQGSQYGSDDWQRFCRANNLAPSMSRRGNCWDNAVAESFFSSLKKERIRKRIYKTRDLARADIFDYIEVFYNRARRHSHLGGVSPEAFEQASS